MVAVLGEGVGLLLPGLHLPHALPQLLIELLVGQQFVRLQLVGDSSVCRLLHLDSGRCWFLPPGRNALVGLEGGGVERTERTVRTERTGGLG